MIPYRDNVERLCRVAPNNRFMVPARRGRILVCEDYPSMREVFNLMLGEQYDLAFAESQDEIMPLLAQSPARLVIWDLNGNGDPLNTLQQIRKIHPAIQVLLVAGEFDLSFQVSAIQQVGLVRFLTKPWHSAVAVAEQIQVMLGDRAGSIRHQVLRMPVT